MKNSSKIKLILLIFFIIFFGFLFWYFYNPTGNLDENGNEIKETELNLFPFGDGTKPEDEAQNQSNNGQKNTNPINEEIPRLRQISNIPTAGVYLQPLTKKEIHEINVENDIFNTEDALKFDEHISEIRYVAKKNGHIYSTYTNSKRLKRISNVTIPKVYEAAFWDKNNLLVRYLDDKKNIKTYSISLKKKTEAEIEEEIKKQGDKKMKINTDLLNFSGVYLPLNIEEFSLLPSTNKIFYLKRGEENMTGVVAESLGQDKKQIFESKLKEWNINWKNENNILINNKASSETYTLSFKLNVKTRELDNMDNILLAGNGLPNNNFTKILYSAKEELSTSPSLFVYDIKTRKLTNLGLKTLVEKCVWAKDNVNVYCGIPTNIMSANEPDNWYKGYTDFSDSMYKINTNSSYIQLIFDSVQEKKNFDIVRMKLDYFEDYLYFIDSMTDYAWSYKIRGLGGEEAEEESINDGEANYELLKSGKKCPSNQILTENLRTGDRNGKYSSWSKKVITEAKILQAHMNRLGFGAGEVDGILGPKTDAAIKRMQKFLGTSQDGMVGPITRGLINNSCE